MEEARGITVKVAQSLHTKAKQEAEANTQTMSQFIEMVLRFYYDRKDEKGMSANKRTLAFQVDEEFYQEVHAYIRAHNMKLKDFGITAMRRMIEEAASDEADAAPDAPSTTPDEPDTDPDEPDADPDEADTDPDEADIDPDEPDTNPDDDNAAPPSEQE